MSRRVSVLLLASITWGALVALGPACAPAGDANGAGAKSLGTGSPPQAFLDLIPNAPSATAYHGRRRVWASWKVAGDVRTLDYHETVSSDGQGAFRIEPGRVSTPRMTAQEEQFFALLQEGRDGFFFRHRDFRIRDLALCLLNYAIQDTGVLEAVAGRTCNVIELRRYSGATSWYRAAVDPQTGLVMRFEELDVQRRLLSKVEFVEFSLGPVPAGVVLHGDRYVSVPIDPDGDTSAQLGFQVQAPRILPAGYRRTRADGVFEDGRHWARLFYGDGVDQVFFLHTRLPAGQGHTAVPTEQYVGPKVLRVLPMGPWTMLEARLGADLYVAVGKVDEAALRRMIQSALG